MKTTTKLAIISGFLIAVAAILISLQQNQLVVFDAPESRAESFTDSKKIAPPSTDTIAKRLADAAQRLRARFYAPENRNASITTSQQLSDAAIDLPTSTELQNSYDTIDESELQAKLLEIENLFISKAFIKKANSGQLSARDQQEMQAAMSEEVAIRQALFTKHLASTRKNFL